MGQACARRAKGPYAGFQTDVSEDVVDVKGDWCKENCIELCKEGEEYKFNGKARLLGGSARTTFAAIQGLNAGWMECHEGFCVVHSASSGSYFLLYTAAAKEAALNCLGLHPDAFDLQWLSQQEALAARLGQATVVLEKQPGQSFGLKLTGGRLAGSIKVHAVNEGLVSEWNAKAPDLEVRPGDVIVKVNGIADDTTRMVEELKKESGTFVCVFNRPGGGFPALQAKPETKKEDPPAVEASPQPYYFEVQLDKGSGGTLGLKLTKSQTGALMVTHVTDASIAQEWNTYFPDRAVLPGDLILGANGVSGDALQVAEVCKSSQVVALQMCRLPKDS
mmetsp:Transcript_15179/g.34604  ORF Transcript_15179/g.34604 Transcript_15179/m.34604 type:complete len:334 (-) Transcript_15179:67-1068(-)